MHCCPHWLDFPPTGGGRTQSLRSNGLFLRGARVAAGPTCAIAQAEASRIAERATRPCLMLPTPCDQETGGSLQRHPDVAVGVHLTLPDMSEHREGTPTALTAARFGGDLRAHHVQLITYRQLIEMQG